MRTLLSLRWLAMQLGANVDVFVAGHQRHQAFAAENDNHVPRGFSYASGHRWGLRFAPTRANPLYYQEGTRRKKRSRWFRPIENREVH